MIKIYPYAKSEITGNMNLRFFYSCLPCLLLACLLFFSVTTLYARENGATIVPVPTESCGFPDTAEAIETLLSHKKGITEPLLYNGEAIGWPAMILTPEVLKTMYGNIPANINNTLNHKEDLVLMQGFEKSVLSIIIKMIESEQYHQRIAIRSTADKESGDIFQHIVKQSTRLETKKELESEDETFSSDLLFSSDLEQYFTFPRSAEKREKTLKILPQTWPHFLKLHRGKGLSKKQLSQEYHKVMRSMKDIPLMLPPQFMTLYVAGKHYVSGLYQPLNNTSHVIIQTHGQQKFMLMSPDHAYNSPAFFDAAGRFGCMCVDLSAPKNDLRNEKRLANTVLYSVILSPGDILLIPANWFIYQQSLSISISATFTYLSDDKLPLLSQSRLIRGNSMLAMKAVDQWAREEVRTHPENSHNILLAAKIINTSIDSTIHWEAGLNQSLNLGNLKLASLPEGIAQMEHIRHLDLHGNRLTTFSMSDMKNLSILDLSDNHLTEFNGSNLPRIKTINLQNNKLVTLGEGCISNMNTNNYLTLDLSGNPLSENEIYQIQLDLLLRQGSSHTTYPGGANLLTKAQLLAKVIKSKAMPYQSFIAMLEQKGVSFLSEFRCPVACAVPEDVICLKQTSVYQPYDADTLIKWVETRFQNGLGASLINPATAVPLKAQDIFSPLQCPLEKICKQ